MREERFMEYRGMTISDFTDDLATVAKRLRSSLERNETKILGDVFIQDVETLVDGFLFLLNAPGEDFWDKARGGNNGDS